MTRLLRAENLCTENFVQRLGRKRRRNSAVTQELLQEYCHQTVDQRCHTIAFWLHCPEFHMLVKQQLHSATETIDKITHYET